MEKQKLKEKGNVGALSVRNTRKNLPNCAQKENKGITLVALIITIIVLLILAVVAIRAVQENGIIGHAKNAKSNYSKAQLEEEILLALNEWKITSNTPTPGNFSDFLESKLGEDDIIIDNGDETCTVIAGDYGVTIDKNGNILDYVGYIIEESDMGFILTSKGEAILFIDSETIRTTYKYADSTIDGCSKIITVDLEGHNMIFAAITADGKIYPNLASDMTQISIDETGVAIVKDDTILSNIKIPGTYECYKREYTTGTDTKVAAWVFDYRTNTIQFCANGNRSNIIFSITSDGTTTEDIGEKDQNNEDFTIPSGASKLKIINSTLISDIIYMYDDNGKKIASPTESSGYLEIYTKDENFNPEEFGYAVIEN